jgi:hypothetical protein
MDLGASRGKGAVAFYAACRGLFPDEQIHLNLPGSLGAKSWSKLKVLCLAKIVDQI